MDDTTKDMDMEETTEDTTMAVEDTATDTSVSDSVSAPAAPAVTDETVNVVFIGSLAWATTDETLRKHFEDAGVQIGEDEVVKNDMTGREYTRKAAVVARYPDTKKSKGYGFVTLANHAEAVKAVELLNGSTLDGREIRVQLKDMTPREDRPRRTGGSFGGDRGGSSRGFGGGDRGSRGGFGGDRGGDRRGGYKDNNSFTPNNSWN